MKEQVARTLLIGPAIRPEQFVAEHFFIYLVKGKLDGYYGNKNYALKPGEYGVVRKNHLGRFNNQKECNTVEKIVFVFDEPFLKLIQEKHNIIATRFSSAESFLKLPENKLILNFAHSLIPYYNAAGSLDKAFFDLKREELLLILLKAQPGLAGVFFESPVPEKIDLAEFMNHHYKFNVKLERFAFLTGRSLSAFKRDFKQTFKDTPGQWLVKRRLAEAHYLIEKKHQRPAEIFDDLGFKDLSHFCYAFKRHFGFTPTQLAEKQSSQM